MAGKLASRVKGLSEAQFREAYGTEERCRAAVEKLRWPKGFVCPLCGSCEGKWLSTRPKIQCRACRHQVSLTAGTIFHATTLPLTSWFLASVLSAAFWVQGVMPLGVMIITVLVLLVEYPIAAVIGARFYSEGQ